MITGMNLSHCFGNFHNDGQGQVAPDICVHRTQERVDVGQDELELHLMGGSMRRAACGCYLLL